MLSTTSHPVTDDTMPEEREVADRRESNVTEVSGDESESALMTLVDAAASLLGASPPKEAVEEVAETGLEETSTSTSTTLVNEVEASKMDSEEEDTKVGIVASSAVPVNVLPGTKDDLYGDASKRICFAEQLMDILDSEEHNDVMQWMPDGSAFTIVNHKKFTLERMPKLFNIRNMSSFVRKLCRWGFCRAHEKETRNSDIFKHEFFRRGEKDLCRRKVKCVGKIAVPHGVVTPVANAGKPTILFKPTPNTPYARNLPSRLNGQAMGGPLMSPASSFAAMSPTKTVASLSDLPSAAMYRSHSRAIHQASSAGPRGLSGTRHNVSEQGGTDPNVLYRQAQLERLILEERRDIERRLLQHRANERRLLQQRRQVLEGGGPLPPRFPILQRAPYDTSPSFDPLYQDNFSSRSNFSSSNREAAIRALLREERLMEMAARETTRTSMSIMQSQRSAMQAGAYNKPTGGGSRSRMTADYHYM